MANLTKEEMREYQRQRRAAKRGATPEHQAEYKEGLNATDRTFEEANPGYYIYEEKEREDQCHLDKCSKRFKTRLLLNKFCCRAHQNEFINRHKTAGSGIGSNVTP